MIKVLPSRRTAALTPSRFPSNEGLIKEVDFNFQAQKWLFSNEAIRILQV